MIACGSSEDHVYIYNMDTGATSSLLLNQYKGRIHHHLVHPLHCLHKARFARSL